VVQEKTAERSISTYPRLISTARRAALPDFTTGWKSFSRRWRATVMPGNEFAVAAKFRTDGNEVFHDFPVERRLNVFSANYKRNLNSVGG
jgi:hypothetical protein